MSNRLILLGLAAFAAGIIARVATEPPPRSAPVAFVSAQPAPTTPDSELAANDANGPARR